MDDEAVGGGGAGIFRAVPLSVRCVSENNSARKINRCLVGARGPDFFFVRGTG